MIFYLQFLFIITILYLAATTNRMLDLVGWYILGIFIIFLACFRYNIGTDYLNYLSIYSSLQDGYSNYNIEIGYKYINLLFVHLKLPYAFSVFFFAFFTNVFMLFFIKKHSIDPMLSLVLYILLNYYFITYNVVRQIMAISIFLLGVDYIFQKKYLKFIAITLFASLFHYTMLLGLIYPFLKNIKLRSLICIWGILLPFIIFPIQTVIMKVVPNSFYYAHYFDSQFFMKSSQLSMLKLILPNILVIVSFIYSKYFNGQYERFWLKLFVFSISIANLANGTNVLMRLNYGFQISEIIFYPLFISKIAKSEKKCICILLVAYAMLFYIGTVVIRGAHGVIPYQLLF